jgi:dolichyl-phosphate-mannose-protein mannosyltransferase
MRHFFARALGLIVVPFIVYSSFFWIHFKVLSHSGTGDHFMTPRFQESLAGNELLLKAHGNIIASHVDILLISACRNTIL